MRLALERLGVSQRAAASASGVTHAALNRALAGDSEPSAELVFKVAEAHGLSLEWLFREQGAMLVGAGAGAAAREIRLAALREAEEAIRKLAADEAASPDRSLTSRAADALAAEELVQAAKAEKRKRSAQPAPDAASAGRRKKSAG